jgi:hypothetical protein
MVGLVLDVALKVHGDLPQVVSALPQRRQLTLDGGSIRRTPFVVQTWPSSVRRTSVGSDACSRDGWPPRQPTPHWEAKK